MSVTVLGRRLSALGDVLGGACRVLLELASLAALYRSTAHGERSNPYIHPMGG